MSLWLDTDSHSMGVSSVWDPHTSCYIKNVEAVQCRAARFITNDYGKKSSVTGFTAMPNEIQLPSLQDRHLNQRLTKVTVHKKSFTTTLISTGKTTLNSTHVTQLPHQPDTMWAFPCQCHPGNQNFKLT